MGISERIEDKLDQVLALLAAAPKKAAPKKVEAAKPAFTAEQLRDKFIEVQDKHGADAAKALIAEQGHDKLAKLIADTANWQKYWDAAEAKLAEDAADDGEDDSGL